jgi:steroid delta-isomerase-like uncharacterized protein
MMCALPGTSPPTRSTAMAKDIRELARRWFEDNWNRRRAEIVDELLAENAVGHMEGTDVHGREEFKAVRATLLGAFPDLVLEVEDTIAEGDKVAVRWSVGATHLGEHFGFAASGKPVRFRGITWLRFDDGMIVEGWDAWNQGEVMQRLQATA